jgi:hypothetical protein
MATKRWLTPHELEVEHRERVRACAEKTFGRPVNDEELDRAWIDLETHMLLMAGRLGNVIIGEDDGYEDETSVH